MREGWFGARPRAGDRGGAGGEAQDPPPGVLGQSGQFGVATRRVRCCGADGCSGAGVGAPTGCPPGRRHRTGRDRGPRCDGEPCRRRTLTAYPAASASASRGSDTSTPCPPVASRLHSSEYRFVSGGRPRPRTPPRRSIACSPRPSTRTGPPAVSAPSRCCPVWPASASSTPHRSPRALDGSVLAVAWFQPPPEVPAGENADAAPRATPGRRWPRTTFRSDLR